ncbi:hypothetical protein NKH77_45090 [Streptomyces sp. M19]
MLYGASCALQVRAGLGLDPWDVLHQGVSEHVGLSIGTVAIAVGAVVLLLWIPLRERPGLGTVSNVVVVGLTMDATLRLVPDVGPWRRAPVAGVRRRPQRRRDGLYISARLGPGPRDGLMTGLHRRSGRSLRLIRTGIEAGVLVAGFALGGSVGSERCSTRSRSALAQFFLRFFAIADPSATPVHGARRDVAGA